ncbi:hypothetical protein AB1L05_19150 [Cytobacillus horneckiae]|uniref:hypothetical protein n=1 Tax=Cytobacillus horneckiae TaxID=549687 RepID=UPI0030B7F88D
MKKYRREALHSQLPPSISMDELNIKVNAKKNAASTPKRIAFKLYAPQLLMMYKPTILNKSSCFNDNH